jgi:ubiquitin-conjugating enzyme E2 variant
MNAAATPLDPVSSPTEAPVVAAVPGPRTPGWHEVGAVWFFALVSAGLLYRAAFSLQGHPGVLLAAAFLGYVASDLASGLVHWGFDTWGSGETPIVGKTFIIPFRVHHSDPMDITRHGFAATNGHTALVASPVLALALLLPGSWAITPALMVLVLSMCAGVFATNQFHKWAHEETPAGWVQWLQRSHLVLGRAHHALHHARPYARNYCITSGWLNGALDAVGFFRGLERAITAVTGAKPRRDDLSQA